MARILYVTGWGRSGTTLLDLLLGQLDGVEPLGEVHYLWERGFLENRLCGCGNRVADCAYWQAVRAELPAWAAHVDRATLDAELAEIKTRHAARILWLSARGRLTERVRYTRRLGALYAAVQSAHAPEVLVDSSKYPLEALLSQATAPGDVYVLHLVRDPRAVAFSWGRDKYVADQPGADKTIRKRGPVRSSVNWVVYNLLSVVIGRWFVPDGHYFRLTYEQLVADPSGTVHEIERRLGRQPNNLPIEREREFPIDVVHSASGNPMRLGARMVRINADTEWTTAMPRWKRMIVTCLTAPAMVVLRYPVRQTPTART